MATIDAIRLGRAAPVGRARASTGEPHRTRIQAMTEPIAALPADLAIPRLLDAHGGRIYSLGLRMCGGDADDAADLVQETFINAFRGWDRFEGRAEPTTWLYTIAARACRRMHRKRSGEPARLPSLSALLPQRDDEVVDIDVADAAEGPLDAVLRAEARDAIEHAIESLPSPFRIALVLKDLADLSVNQIADVLGLQPATVKTRVHRARLALRKALAEDLPRRPAPPPDHPRGVCLDLLKAKQDALDRGVAFPVPQAELCARCRGLFSTLDLARGTCRRIGAGELPAPVRAALLARFASDRGPRRAQIRPGEGRFTGAEPSPA